MTATETAAPWTPAFRILTADQIEAIHDASMRILGETGVRIYEPRAITLLRDAGATVDGDLVTIPADLVEWAVGVAPDNVTIYDRTGREAMRLGGRRTYFGTGSDTPNTIDPRTGERRRATLTDVGDFARVCDALDGLDFVMCMGIASDKSSTVAELFHFREMLKNTTKPMVYTALDLDAANRLLEMASIVSGGEERFRERPFGIMYLEPVSPLGFAAEVMQKLLFCAEHGIPCIFMSGMLCGGTGPVTQAGSLALANAESLAGITIAQLKREGAPVVSGGGIIGMDMRTAISSYSSPEFMLTMGALSEMAEHYGLPAYGYAGCSDAKTFDEQAAADAALWVMAAQLSGSNLVHDVGFVESGLTSSLDQVVFTSEMISKCSRILRGIAVDEESLAVDVTREVGPGGSFLFHKHTRKHLSDNWRPDLEDRTTYGAWVAQGSNTMRDRVRGRVLELLDTHVPEPLSEDVDVRLTALLTAAEAGDG
jgi:trimethylamine--corrinoid protein Co-methyltransferase